MSERSCANCGKKKDVYGGKICSKEHFICKSCAFGRSTCPLCGHSLH